jgi:transcriptional regulator with XRE-family HTH domain
MAKALLTRHRTSGLMHCMDIGKRLRELREARGLSQGDIERRSGLLRSYISRVEGGFTVPSLTTLEKFAETLEMEPYQLLYLGKGKPTAVKAGERTILSKASRKLVKMFDGMSSSNRKLLLILASKLGKD